MACAGIILTTLFHRDAQILPQHPQCMYVHPVHVLTQIAAELISGALLGTVIYIQDTRSVPTGTFPLVPYTRAIHTSAGGTPLHLHHTLVSHAHGCSKHRYKTL